MRGAVTWAAARLPQRACARVFAPSAPSSSSSSSRRAARAWLRGDGLRVRVCVRARAGMETQGLAPGCGVARAGERSQCGVHVCAHGGQGPGMCAPVRTRRTGAQVACAFVRTGGSVCVHLCAHGKRMRVYAHGCVCTYENAHMDESERLCACVSAQRGKGPSVCRCTWVYLLECVHTGRKRVDFVATGVYVHTWRRGTGVPTCRCAHLEEEGRLGV